MICPTCAEEAPDDAKWCEACGQDLATEPLPTCVSCGERQVGEDGYCQSCGHKQPEERDHLELRHRSIVAVTDRGRRHRHNEDAVAIGQTDEGAAVLVVCDGVSSTPGSAAASERAAGAARDLLMAGLEDGVVDVDTLLAKAVEAAQSEASASVEPDDTPTGPYAGGGPASSTLVAVVARPGVGATTELSTAWVGDSRAYWIDEAGGQRLTPVDHELNGSLIRWLGADSIDPTPDLSMVEVTGPGWLVVCSDGLWRYASEPAELRAVIDRLRSGGARGVGLASALVGFANEQGGHDNITVALWSDDPENLDRTPAPPQPPGPPGEAAEVDPTPTTDQTSTTDPTDEGER